MTAKIVWKNIYPLPSNSVGETNFPSSEADKAWAKAPPLRFTDRDGKRDLLKVEEPEVVTQSEPSKATMASL